MQTESLVRQRSTFSRDHLFGACAYFTFLPALAFLFLGSYRRSPLVRFHSVQCLLLWLVGIASALVVRLLALLFLFVPMIGPLLAVLFVTIAALAALFLWIVLVVKALQGERFALPVIGGMAEKYSSIQ